MKLFTCTFLLLVSSCCAQSQPVVTIFHAFPRTQNGHYPQGVDPRQPIEGAGGNLIGVTNVGGNVGGDCSSNFGSNLGCGTVYLLNSAGQRKGLFDFPYDPQSAINHYPNGAYPFGTLVQGRDSQFYGVTQGGTRHQGFGTIFKVNASGQLQTLHVFCQQAGCVDGASPHGTLTRGTDGYFYGTTFGKATGGAVIYRISPGGAFQIVRTLSRHDPNGTLPIGNLLLASDGNFYGYSNIPLGEGKIFRLTPAGTVTTFYLFGSQPSDGAYPSGSLIQATDGNLYGATGSGGTNGVGTIFRISLAGDYSKIFDFGNGAGDNPSEPMQASDGNLWGTTLLGSIYTITPTGTLLQSIPIQCPVGQASGTAFTQAVNGKLYTSAFECQGPNQGGAIIEVDAGLPPPLPLLAAFTPASGTAGTTVVLSGAHFVSASSVTFNGMPATFVVNASGVVSATVLNGASSGPIQITVPGGTASSSSSFTVTPQRGRRPTYPWFWDMWGFCHPFSCNTRLQPATL